MRAQIFSSIYVSVTTKINLKKNPLLGNNYRLVDDFGHLDLFV